MKTVNVLMSTYNGERFIEEQIDSIMAQQGVEIVLTIRDDGSTDQTCSIISQKQKEYSDKINLYCGNNMGYQKSFLKLLSLASEADYYAFSDQDDIWLQKKCIAAIKRLNSLGEKIALYSSAVTITDSSLNVIKINHLDEMPSYIESHFTRARLPGCTFVFTPALKEITERFWPVIEPMKKGLDYDFVIASIGFGCGIVTIDSCSYILHRRHENALTSGGRGIINRIRTEWALIFTRKDFNYKMSKMLLQICTEELRTEEKEFLKSVAKYKTSFHDKAKLLLNRKLSSGILLCDIEARLKILLSNF